MIPSSELNITYLLGAGASAQALPIVRKVEGSPSMSQAFIQLAQQLEQFEYDAIYKDYIIELKKNLKWLADGTDEFGTPDTYAKYLFLSNPPELNKLKNSLSAYFIFEQILNKKFDKRALIFLTSIIQEGLIFPENIKILNWNYDFQMQLAAEVFAEERYTMGDGASVHSPGLVQYFPGLGNNNYPASNQTSLVHLHGIAGAFYNHGFQRLNSIYEKKENRAIDNILQILTTTVFDQGNLLSFAWENNATSQNRREYVKKVALNTDILVVVGYSFPFFNRQIDKEIFSHLKEGGRLKKIYFQDPYKSGIFLQNQFNLSDSIEIKTIVEKDNYFIPMEL